MNMTHGTITAYKNYRCRCDDCRRANTDTERRRRGVPANRSYELLASVEAPEYHPSLEQRTPTLDGAGSAWWMRGHDGWPGGTPEGWRVAHLHAQLVGSTWIVTPEGRGKPLTVLLQDRLVAAHRRTA